MNNNIAEIINFIEEDNLNIPLIGELAIEVAQPLNVDDYNPRERPVIPRNSNYYEEIIPLYMGDLFKEHFRMSRATFEELHNTLHNAGVLPPAPVVPTEKKLLFTLSVLAKPECFLSVSDRFGIARSTGHHIFKEVVAAINSLLPQYVIWQQNYGEATRIFHERSRGFPGVIGAIDGCHIPIKQPVLNANDYYNRKQFHSIILQGICDHRMLFIDIFIGMPGRMHDARVWRNSPIYNQIINNENPIIPQDLHIIGDSAYPLMKNLLTPFRNNGHLTPGEVNYNYRLSSIRSVIERAFGRLKGKFRRLKSLDISHPDFGTEIIAAACVLHNFLILTNEDEDVDDEEIEPEDEMDEEIEAEPNEDRNVGAEKRRNIVELLRQ